MQTCEQLTVTSCYEWLQLTCRLIYNTCIHIHADQYSLHDSGSTNTVEGEKRPTPEADWKQVPSFIRDGKFNVQLATLIHVGSDNDNIVMMLCRALLAATLVLLPLLGLTWVFGILTVNANSTIFAWLFTIFNSLQVSCNSPGPWHAWSVYHIDCKLLLFNMIVYRACSSFSFT